jgi:hypothetical protein
VLALCDGKDTHEPRPHKTCKHHTAAKEPEAQTGRAQTATAPTMVAKTAKKTPPIEDKPWKHNVAARTVTAQTVKTGTHTTGSDLALHGEVSRRKAESPNNILSGGWPAITSLVFFAGRMALRMEPRPWCFFQHCRGACNFHISLNLSCAHIFVCGQTIVCNTYMEEKKKHDSQHSPNFIVISFSPQPTPVGLAKDQMGNVQQSIERFRFEIVLYTSDNKTPTHQI